MISRQIPVAVVLANLLIIVSSSQISDKFMSRLCRRELQPQQVYELLKSHPNEEEKIDFTTVGELIDMKELAAKPQHIAWFAWHICASTRKYCPNIFKYCIDSYEKMLQTSYQVFHPEEISPVFMSQLCKNELQPHEVYELLENHRQQGECISFTTVEELVFIGHLNNKDKDNLNMYKSICRFGKEVCGNIERYCEDRLRRLEEFCNAPSQPSEGPMDIDDSQDKGGQKRASESTSTRLSKLLKLM